jgi:hypothetical protein
VTNPKRKGMGMLGEQERTGNAVSLQYLERVKKAERIRVGGKSNLKNW